MRFIVILILSALILAMNQTITAVGPSGNYTAEFSNATDNPPVRRALYIINVVGPSGNYTAELFENTLVIDNKKYPIPPARYSPYFNKSYTVYLINYDEKCQFIQGPSRPEFLVRCTIGSDFTVVAVKDPQARVICKANDRVISPKNESNYLAIYETKALSIECRSDLSAVVTMSTQLIAALASISAALFGATAVLAFALLKRALK